MECMLDFVRASSYWADLVSSPVTEGADGNLIHEFMEMERIMLEQSQTIGSPGYPQGSYQPYVCRVAGKIGNMGLNHECLDIASAKTLSKSSSGQNHSDFWNSTLLSKAGQLRANKFTHTNIMVDINENHALLTTDMENLFGFNVTGCEGTENSKIMGDGVINSFDLFIVAAVQFSQGPYAVFSNSPYASIPTVSGRPDTKDRCCMDNTTDCQRYDRLDWQKRIAFKDCFTIADEDTYNSDRRLQETYGIVETSAAAAFASSSSSLFVYNSNPRVVDEAAERAHALSHQSAASAGIALPESRGWSRYGLYNIYNATHAFPVEPVSLASFDALGIASASEDGDGGGEGRRRYSMGDLDVSVMEYAPTTQGTWYWVNIPSVHLSMELSFSSLGIHDPIPISNDRAPNYLQAHIPYKPEKPNLRFVRHREFYDMDTSDCAVIQSSRRARNAMENGVAYISQSMRNGKFLCGFDLMIWKPASDPYSSAAQEPMCILAGSMSMSGDGGGMQHTTRCASSMSDYVGTSPPPPLQLPPPPPPPHLKYSVYLTVELSVSEFNDLQRSDYNSSLYSFILGKVPSSPFEGPELDVQQNQNNYFVITAKVTFENEGNSDVILSEFNDMVNQEDFGDLSSLLEVNPNDIIDAYARKEESVTTSTSSSSSPPPPPSSPPVVATSPPSSLSPPNSPSSKDASISTNIVIIVISVTVVFILLLCALLFYFVGRGSGGRTRFSSGSALSSSTGVARIEDMPLIAMRPDKDFS